ncbi:putative RNA-dependent RNA polymerase 1 [Wolffia australiana]
MQSQWRSWKRCRRTWSGLELLDAINPREMAGLLKKMMLSCGYSPGEPHPNECSGSDLDGDIYFVCWDPELIPPCQVEFIDYTPSPQVCLDRDVTMECRELAKLFSIAVNFPKTGVPAVVLPSLTTKEFRDFMEKLDKPTFTSKSVIGKLFNAVIDLDSAVAPEFTHFQAVESYDMDIEIDVGIQTPF